MAKKASKSLHERRGVTYQELGAFFAVKAMLQEKVLTYAKNPWIDLSAGNHLINMDLTSRAVNCGSVGCIGGNMAIIMGRDPDEYVIGHKNDMGEFSDLFYPPEQYDYEKITAKHMLRAMKNWQRTGKPMWSKILPKSCLEQEE